MIDLVLVTWPNHPKRVEYLRRTWEALQKNLTASRHTIRFLCSSESERDPTCEWCGDALEDFCQKEGIELHWRSGPASLGAAMNSATALCTAPVHVLHQDDFELVAPLDISPVADFLVEHPEVAIHRLSYFTHPRDGTQFSGAIGPFRQVNINGPWPYGDCPQMRRRDFTERYGKYIEGGRHGASEGAMLHELVRRQAVITAGDRCYYGNFGQVPALPTVKEYRKRNHYR